MAQKTKKKKCPTNEKNIPDAGVLFLPPADATLRRWMPDGRDVYKKRGDDKANVS